jgi:hypothetical protein
VRPRRPSLPSRIAELRAQTSDIGQARCGVRTRSHGLLPIFLDRQPAAHDGKLLLREVHLGATALGRDGDMTHSNLRVEVQGTNIVVVLRGTCFRAKYRKQNAPWLATDEYGPDDLDAPMTLSEFRNAAWAAANDVARQLGWIKNCDELHRAAKLAGSQ